MKTPDKSKYRLTNAPLITNKLKLNNSHNRRVVRLD